MIIVCTLNPPLFLSSVLPSVVGVAVTKRSSKNLFIGNLGGRRSCQGHMYSPAGWLLPYRHTLSLEHNSSSACDPNQGAVVKPSRKLFTDICFKSTLIMGKSCCSHSVCVSQCTVRCFGKAVFLVHKGIFVKCVWGAPGRLQPNAVLTTTMSVTMATWGL